jgi:hypothetical protein
MNFIKVDAGSYRYGKWQIDKLHGAWLVKKGDLFPEHSTWSSTLRGAKEFVMMMERKLIAEEN